MERESGKKQGREEGPVQERSVVVEVEREVCVEKQGGRGAGCSNEVK